MIYSLATTAYDVHDREAFERVADAFVVLQLKGESFVVYLQTSRPASVVYRMLHMYDVCATSMRAMLDFTYMPYGPVEVVVYMHGSFKTSYGRRLRNPSFVEAPPPVVIDLTGSLQSTGINAVIDLTCDEAPPGF